jgi:hypothetical protein
MYSRVLYEHWHSIVPIVAFAVTFAVFTIAVIRSVMMRKEKADMMAAMPLDEGDGDGNPNKP